MDNVTLPRSFADTTPAEQMKPISRRRKSSPSQRSPILENPQAHNAYTTIAPEQRNSPSEREHSPEQDPEHEDTPRQPWIGKRIWDGILAWEREHLELVLENKQSVARDHLGNIRLLQGKLTIANERTYLAWLRTSLSFASIGVAITQLFRLSTTIQPGQSPGGYGELRRLGRPLGATFIGIAVLVLLLGVQRYALRGIHVDLGILRVSIG